MKDTLYLVNFNPQTYKIMLLIVAFLLQFPHYAQGCYQTGTAPRCYVKFSAAELI